MKTIIAKVRPPWIDVVAFKEGLRELENGFKNILKMKHRETHIKTLENTEAKIRR